METRESRLAAFFMLLSNPTRMRMLYALMDVEYCVSDLAERLEMNQSAISHQLRLLRESGVITARRKGKQMLYSIADDHIRAVIHEGEKYLMLRP